MPKSKPEIPARWSKTEGEHHDLSDILERVLASSPVLSLADGSVTIGWYGSRDVIRKKRIFLAWYCSDIRHIQVNRILDQSWVPEYYLRYIVGHEVLHHLIPWEGREFHSPTFVKAETALPGYRRAVHWFEKNQARLL